MPTIMVQPLPQPVRRQAKRQNAGGKPGKTGLQPRICPVAQPAGFRHPLAIIGEKTIADAILNRLVHTSHRIELKGASLRKRCNIVVQSVL